MKTILLFCAVFALLWTAGCGGGSKETTGRLTVNVKWPEKSRVIPEASNSIKIEIFDGANRVAFRTINRPATQASFTGLPVANLLLKATAFPEDPGDPPRTEVIAQASGSIVVPLQAGNNPAVSVTMNSTIDNISVTAATLVVNGPTETLTATARDAAGSVVLLTPTKLSWVSASPGVASVTNTGVVSAVAPGVSVITVTDSESQKSGSAPVTVSAQGGTLNVIVTNPPTGTRSVRIEISNGAQILASRNLAWASGDSLTDSFTGVPAGAHTLTATAMSQDSGGGSALGSGSQPVSMPSLGTVTATVTIVSAVTTLAFVPANPSILQGQTVALAVQARDASNNPIATLVTTDFVWQATPNPDGSASANTTGVVTGLTPGTVRIRATDPRTSQFAETNVIVTPNSASAGGVVR